MFGKFVLGLFIEIATFQQRLGGDTAHVQTGAAEGFCHFHAGGFQAQLGAAERRHIAAGAAADDNHFIITHGKIP